MLLSSVCRRFLNVKTHWLGSNQTFEDAVRKPRTEAQWQVRHPRTWQAWYQALFHKAENDGLVHRA